MKKFSQLITETKGERAQSNSLNKLSVKQIEKYLDVADKFISKEAKSICKWLIDNNEDYEKKLPKGAENNSLIDFYNKGVPKNEDYKDLYNWIKSVIKSGRPLEIPTLLTQEQYDLIVGNKKAPEGTVITPDSIIMGLYLDPDSAEGKKARNIIATKYTPLVHKIVNSWIGKSSLDKDELFSNGLFGLTYAMDTYGKKSKKAVGKEQKELERLRSEAEQNGANPDDITLDNVDIVDMDKYRDYPFLQYAAQMIRVWILEAIKNDSHLVRIPISKQKKEKEEKGVIAKDNSVSGDKRLGGKDGEEGKSIFDLVGGMENPSKTMDKLEIERLWTEILDELEKKFGHKTMDIFKNHFGFGLKDKEKRLSGKEMAAKYGFKSPSSITTEIVKVLNFIKKDKKMFQRFCDINELMAEAKHDEDEYSNDNEPINLDSKVYEERMHGNWNNIDGD